jgi:hypothetical protein
MWCCTVKTRCRLCGVLFNEYVCSDETGRAWKESAGHPLEDGSAWCPQCMEGLNRTCDTLCAGIDLGAQDRDSTIRLEQPIRPHTLEE